MRKREIAILLCKRIRRLYPKEISAVALNDIMIAIEDYFELDVMEINEILSEMECSKK